MAFELAKAYVAVEADSRKLPGQLNKVQSQFTTAVGKMSKVAAGLGAALGAGAVIAGLRGIANESLRLLEIQQQAERKLSAVIRATGVSAGFTTDQLQRYASKLQTLTTFGDEAILGIMAKLATFRTVSGDVFKTATELALDLAEVGFGTAESAAVMLGKALEDPVRGLTALRRVGVSFNDEQKERIVQLVEENRLWEA
jgi:hypothetical protein